MQTVGIKSENGIGFSVQYSPKMVYGNSTLLSDSAQTLEAVKVIVYIVILCNPVKGHFVNYKFA